MLRPFSTALATSLFALVAVPAFAQDLNLCAGIGESGQWLGGDEESSDISTSPSYIEQMALVLMRSEYVGLFTVSQEGEYRIEAQADDWGDTVLDIRNENGAIIASDDDSGGDLASRAEIFLTPGTYCASMRSFGGTPFTGVVRAARIDEEPLTPGFEEYNGVRGTGECNLADAQPITFGEPVANSWSAQTTYSLTLDAPLAITLTAENEMADPILGLYDSDGNWLAENDDFDGLNSRIDMADPLAAGEYCISVGLYGDESAPITVTAKEYDPDEVRMNLYARGEASPPLDGSYPIANLGELQTRMRKDVSIGANAEWFSFEVATGGLVLIEAIAQGPGDPVLIMYDDLGRQIGYNDDNDSLNSLLTVRVQPGTYAVAVKQWDENTSALIRVLFERYVPAEQ